LVANPLDAEAHRELAQALLEGSQLLAAYAEARTASALGGDPARCAEVVSRSRLELDQRMPLDQLDHNRSYRFRSLARAVVAAAGERCRILDVGGGDGGLGRFLPEASYVLVEPTVNGIGGEDLPFPDRSFDVVTACHVLEHVPADARPAFLDELLRVSARHLILLNPFLLPDALYPERLELILAVTGAEWAREHLECGLPELGELERFAAERNLALKVRPNGTLLLSLTTFFMGYFAVAGGRRRDLARISELLNRLPIDRLTDSRLPVAHLVHLERGDDPKPS
jgi:SAM-dependent methyltransferase